MSRRLVGSRVETTVRLSRPRILWRPSLAWAVAMAVIMAIGILNLGGQSEFLYWQF